GEAVRLEDRGRVLGDARVAVIEGEGEGAAGDGRLRAEGRSEARGRENGLSRPRDGLDVGPELLGGDGEDRAGPVDRVVGQDRNSAHRAPRRARSVSTSERYSGRCEPSSQSLRAASSPRAPRSDASAGSAARRARSPGSSSSSSKRSPPPDSSTISSRPP